MQAEVENGKPGDFRASVSALSVLQLKLARM